MIPPYQRLANRIRNEISDMEIVIQRMQKALQQANKNPDDQGFYLDSVALNLHNFYSGIERLFELIARYVDRSIPKGETWHRDLLQQMAKDTPDLRPAVIDEDSILALDELRRFRHVVVNIYTINLIPEKIIKLTMTVKDIWPNIRSELLAFAELLDEIVIK